MKILFVYPGYPDTFWSFKHALKFVSKKAAFPPLGLLTVAAMLPDKWEKRLIDMNVSPLDDSDINWADYVFISAMVVQNKSAHEVAERCKKLGVKTVAGGPLFTANYEEFDDIDHFVLGEAEVTLKPFLEDLEKGQPSHIYTSDERPRIDITPIPDWSLINLNHYSSMSLQYSRGCPYDCEFCDIVALNGHTPRTKNKDQFIAELESIYANGWRGSVFIVDDNFIGNKTKLKTAILPEIIKWSKDKKHPFAFNTEASINLADDEELMKLMVNAGFGLVFVGIETPNDDSLKECTKYNNQNRNLVDSVNKLQQSGLEVQGGFIVGFDNDPESIFQTQIDFIQKSGIVTAMVGLLNAPKGTRLYQRLKKEGRLTNSFTGDNTDFSFNFIPKMDPGRLIEGYRHILDTIYSPKEYYRRIRTFLRVYKSPKISVGRVQRHQVIAFFKSIWFLGMQGEGRTDYWILFISYLMTSPSKFAKFILLAIYGYHFRRVAMEQIRS